MSWRACYQHARFHLGGFLETYSYNPILATCSQMALIKSETADPLNLCFIRLLTDVETVSTQIEFQFNTGIQT